jgi:hypothetical protein
LSRLGVELHEAAATFPYQATFKEPEQYATGIEWILINGRAVVEEGKPTGALPGRVLLGPGTK